MADGDKRLRYYTGQFLQEQDFTAEQQYHLDRQRRHNRQLHTPGIADGLTVTANAGSRSATVSSGTAIDGAGNVIVLTESQTVLFEPLAGQWVLVVIAYREQASDPAPTGDEGDTRWWEHPKVEVIAEAGAPAADFHVRLARLRLAANGAVTEHDTSVRSAAVAKVATGNLKVPNPLGESLQIVQDQNGAKSSLMLATTHVEINTDSTRSPVLTVAGNVPSAALLEVRNQKNEASIRYLNLDNADKVAWHVGTGGAGGPKNFFFWNDSAGPVGKVVAKITPEGDAAVTGNLSVGGHIQVTGNVDGRDVSSDGAKLDKLASATLEGVSNPGGNIDLIGQAGIAITGDNNAKTITIANAAGGLRAQNPLGDLLQPVKDQNGNQSPVLISTKNVEVNSESEQAFIFKVVGTASAAPLMEVRNRKNEASIRYLNMDSADNVAWHVGTGGAGGAKNFFFWNDSMGTGKVVATITPEGSLTLKGGLTVNGGLSMRRVIVTEAFSHVDGDGTIKTIETGFQPKFISLEGRAHVWLGAVNAHISYGGGIGGFCHVSDSGQVVRVTGHGPHIARLDAPPYLSFFNAQHATSGNAFGSVAFLDHTLNPKLHVYLEVLVESITSTGFRLKLFRKTDTGLMSPTTFGLDLAFAVLG